MVRVIWKRRAKNTLKKSTKQQQKTNSSYIVVINKQTNKQKSKTMKMITNTLKYKNTDNNLQKQHGTFYSKIADWRNWSDKQYIALRWTLNFQVASLKNKFSCILLFLWLDIFICSISFLYKDGYMDDILPVLLTTYFFFFFFFFFFCLRRSRLAASICFGIVI